MKNDVQNCTNAICLFNLPNNHIHINKYIFLEKVTRKFIRLVTIISEW